MSFQISLCDRSKIIVNQTEWKFTQRGGGGKGGILNSSSLLKKLKVTRKILSELQNKRKNEKENKKKQLSVQSRVKR